MPKSGLLANLWNKGELPTVNTEVTFSNRTLITVAFVVIVVATIIILSSKLIKKI